MLRLPTRFAALILSFAPLFFQRSWRHAEVLSIEATLAPGKRTVSAWKEGESNAATGSTLNGLDDAGVAVP